MNKIFFVLAPATLVIVVLWAIQDRQGASPAPPQWRFEPTADGDSVMISPPPDWRPLPEIATLVSVHPLLTPPQDPPNTDALGPKLWGTVRRSGEQIHFRPSAKLTPGQPYFVGLAGNEGGWQAWGIVQVPLANGPAPKVSVFPAKSLPANALKLYLQFSEPMEQGVMLENLRLLDQEGAEVPGAFRETELWSPDGRRLTVWFHPGRQKTSVQLGIDEGPVLIAGHRYQVVIDGSWRDSQGQPLGAAVTHDFTATEVDHHRPDPAKWVIVASSHSISVTFDEPLDQAMLPLAMTLQSTMAGSKAIGFHCVAETDGRTANLVPATPLSPGSYTLRIDPMLEDLAGNNLLHPFEVDLRDAAPAPDPVLERRFEINH